MAQLTDWPGGVTCRRTVEEAREMPLDAAHQLIPSDRMALVNLNGTIIAPRPNRPWPDADCPGEERRRAVCGKFRARLDVAAGGPMPVG